MATAALEAPAHPAPTCTRSQPGAAAPFTLVYCRTCLTPNTRPNGRFDAEGVCTACEFVANMTRVNYPARFAELCAIVKRKTRTSRSRRHQCIVGVSGGKDSTRQALWVREKLGLNPLLVSVAFPPRQISPIGARNLSNLISLGFDTLVIGPAPRLSRDLFREAFFRFANWNKATEMALFSGVPQVAIDRKIPLILWGENPALQVGDLGTLGASIWDGQNLINSNTLAGGDLTWFREVAGDDRRLFPYKFPSRQALQRAGVQTVFLGPAWKDWSVPTNSAVSIAHGLTHRTDGPELTGDLLGTGMIDEDWIVVNMLLKYYKLGFSRGTEQANEFIRAGRWTREQGIVCAEQYDGACGPRYLESFCQYLGITESTFWATVRKFANPHLFDLSGPRPVPRFRVGHGLV
ncbi:MAG TPA: N-acetyl sugar amidotransferase [Lacunisphaera sp.]|nr:N-acetyl sugar amidotransferase [Lacunisphaera sp.]